MFDKAKIHELYPEAENLMFEPMLCWKLPAGKEYMLSEVCSNGEYFLEEKIDGAWYQFVKTDNFSYLFGRTVSKTTGILTEKGGNVPHIVDAFSCLPAGTIIIGEIHVPGGTSKDVTHIMGCLSAEAIRRQQKEGNIHYYCHDILAYDGVSLVNEGAETRYRILQAIWNLHSLDSYDFLRLAEKIEENLEAEVSRILKAGGEGAVLKKRNAPYTPGKRPAWDTIKCKQMDSIDLVITRTIEPTREYTGKDIETWPYWERQTPTFYDCFEEDHCFGGWGNPELVEGNYYFRYKNNKHSVFGVEDKDEFYTPVTKPYYLGWHTSIGIGAYNDEGKLIELGTVSSGITDEMRRQMTETPENYVGRVCSLDCMSIDRKEKTLRHPVFKCMRDDKNPHECLINEVF